MLGCAAEVLPPILDVPLFPPAWPPTNDQTSIAMLSRVANSLYWMSRYIERAENTARIVDTNLQLLLDFRNLDDSTLAEHWMPIVQSTGDDEAFLTKYPHATGQAVTQFLVFDTSNPNSIASSIAQ